MTNEEYFNKRFDIRWTCPDCEKVSYSNKGYATRQCTCKNMSAYMRKEYTAKGLKNLKKSKL